MAIRTRGPGAASLPGPVPMEARAMRRSCPLPSLRRLAVAVALPACPVMSPPVSPHVPLDRQTADLDNRIAIQPRDATLYLTRGEVRRGLSDWKGAAADYRRARELDPNLDAVDLCLGRMLVEAGRPAEAIPILDRFLAR